MVERGARLSSRTSIAAAAPTSDNNQVPAALWGRTVRSALLAPRRGFRKALDLHGSHPGGRGRLLVVSLPAALGGAFLLLVFLKVRSLLGAGAVEPENWGIFSGALAVGALCGVLAHVAFGAGAGPLLGRLGTRVSAPELRLIWGIAAVPVAIGFVVLLGLDLAIAGREAYAEVSGDTLVTGWTAGSLALAVALAAWSIYLFAHGLAVAAEIPPRRSIMALVLAGACLLVAAPVAFLLVIGIATLVELLVDVFQAVSK